ncbi:MAG: universal stress protein [Gammaproteobacteria bacterium]|nr:universal stress protein [Gammaproteobacteria bacterium]
MYQTILVPIDLNHKSSYVTILPAAAEEARYHAATLYVMTVVPDITAGMDWRYAIRGAKGGSERYGLPEMMKQARERITALVKELVPAGFETKVLAKHGSIYKEILDVAEEIDADLIFMAAYRPSVKDYLLGSNASRVVRHARCSVTVVRDKE